MSDDKTDESEWSDVLSGDGEAFGRIFDRHRARVARHCSRLVDVAADADDLVSVVFLEAWRRRHSLRFVDGSLLPWLLVTSTNLSRNLARKSRRYRQVLQGIPPKVHEDDDPADLHGSDVQEALQRLALNDQRVIALCVLEGFSEKDAAQALGVPQGTIKSRLSRAKARLALDLSNNHAHQLSTEATNEA